MIESLPSRCRSAIVAVTCGMVVLGAVGPFAQDVTLGYAWRGNRSEGLKPLSVSGLDIELLSARVGPADPFASPPPRTGWAAEVGMRFYLPRDSNGVSITVRELRPRDTYYFLDKVNAVFQPGSENRYSWPTETVLKKLSNIGPSDLGATVRVGPAGAAYLRVLPALLEGSVDTSAKKAYHFYFKTNGSAKVTAKVYLPNSTTPVVVRHETREQPNSPFAVTSGQVPDDSPEGWYRLVLEGYYLESNERLYREVQYYHRPGH